MSVMDKIVNLNLKKLSPIKFREVVAWAVENRLRWWSLRNRVANPWEASLREAELTDKCSAALENS